MKRPKAGENATPPSTPTRQREPGRLLDLDIQHLACESVRIAVENDDLVLRGCLLLQTPIEQCDDITQGFAVDC